jgi:hypothetical protein
LKTTRYFDEQVRRKRPYLLMEWFVDFQSKAIKRIVQDDGRIKYWISVQQPGEDRTRWLRIICLDDDETLHNAFFDRDFEEPSS